MVLRGTPVAEAMIAEVAAAIKARKLNLSLVIVMLGENPASETYIQKKLTYCKRAGIQARIERVDPACTQEELHELIGALNVDPAVTGYIIQLPLPKHLSIQKAVPHMLPHKDVDGFTALNAGKLFLGNDEDYLPPATSRAVVKLLEFYDIPVAGKNAVVVGRSNLVGKPLAIDLLARDATVTLCHSRTPDLGAVTRQADIVVSAVGKLHLITEDMVKSGAVLVDVGFNMTPDGLFGDIDAAACAKASAYAPVPGGVGSVTVCQLLENVLRAHELSLLVS